MKKTDFISELKSTRGNENSYMVNFIGNFARAATLMHKILAQFGKQDELVREASKSYIVSIVSCLETFYRDLFTYVLSLDESTLERVLPDLKEKPTYSNMHTLLKQGVEFSDIVATEANFQSIAEIDSFMSKLFFPNSYLKELDSFSFRCFVPARSIQANMKLDQDWPLSSPKSLHSDILSPTMPISHVRFLAPQCRS